MFLVVLFVILTFACPYLDAAARNELHEPLPSPFDLVGLGARVVGVNVAFGTHDTASPGVWRARQRWPVRVFVVVLVSGVPTFALVALTSGFFLWDGNEVRRQLDEDVRALITGENPPISTLSVFAPSRDWRDIRERFRSVEDFRPLEPFEDRPRDPWDTSTFQERMEAHYEKETKQRQEDYEWQLDRTLEPVCTNNPYYPVGIALIGFLSRGDTTYLGAAVTATALTVGLVPLYLAALVHPLLLHGLKQQRLVEQLVADDERTLWECHVDRLSGSPHRAETPDTREEVREANHLFLGVHDGRDVPILLDRSILAEHAYFVGQSGSGKTSLGLLPVVTQLIRGNGLDDTPTPVVVLDLKGDAALFHTVRHEAERRGQRFAFFTPERGRATHVFDPFQALGGETRNLMQLCQLMLDSLGLNHGEGYGRSYYSRQGREALFAALQTDPPPASFEELYATLQTFRGRADYPDSFELLSTIHALTQYPQLRTNADQREEVPAIHMPTLLENCEVAYFWLPAAIESISVREIGKLAVFALLTAAIERQRAGHSERQCFLVIDEFQRLAGENFKVVLEQARSDNVGLLLANQSQQDLRTAAADLRSAVRTNTRHEQFFTLSDTEEIRELSTLSGRELAFRQGFGRPRDGGGFQLTSLGQTEKPRLDTNDILGLGDDPLQSVVHVSRGSGDSQFAGLPFVMTSLFSLSREAYDERRRAPWPSPEKDTDVPDVDFREIDAQRARRIVEQQEDRLRGLFDEQQDRFLANPE